MVLHAAQAQMGSRRAAEEDLPALEAPAHGPHQGVVGVEDGDAAGAHGREQFLLGPGHAAAAVLEEAGVGVAHVQLHGQVGRARRPRRPAAHPNDSCPVPGPSSAGAWAA